MKYKLPDDLKTYAFFCDKVIALTTLRGCKRRCHNDCRNCWEQHLRTDLRLDCQVENERNAEKYAVCPECGSKDITGVMFNGFLCNECGTVVKYDSAEQKKLMGDAYMEIDEAELAAALQAIK